eukprot:scaffold201855_cov46-Cyclotella_meneghiniana.AAC.1
MLIIGGLSTVRSLFFDLEIRSFLDQNIFANPLLTIPRYDSHVRLYQSCCQAMLVPGHYARAVAHSKNKRGMSKSDCGDTFGGRGHQHR